jgi:hypothetical protein
MCSFNFEWGPGGMFMLPERVAVKNPAHHEERSLDYVAC